MSNMAFAGNHLKVLKLDNGIAELRLDNENAPVNTLSVAFANELRAAIENLCSDSSLEGILLTSAKDAFLAGADIQALASLLKQSAEEQIAFCTNTAQVLTEFEDLPAPIVCAINGYALGGGLEMALCSDYRILAANAFVGFPEAGLGVLPGVGGTVRTPRLTNAATALKWLSEAGTHKAVAALDAGIVDAIAEPDALQSTALEWLQKAMEGHLDWRNRRQQRKGSFSVDSQAFSAARNEAEKRAKHFPAALTIVDLLKRSAPLSRDEAFALEAESFSFLAQSNTAKALVANFQSLQAIKKKNKAFASQAKQVERVGILGAGIMGGGIAHTTAMNGMQVVLKDIDQQALDLGISEAQRLLNKKVKSGKMTAEQADTTLHSITPTLTFDSFDNVDLVVEAVVEDLAVKRKVLAQVESTSKPETVLASNTSSLSIADIASPLKRLENVVGMHFFNPVPVMRLVEVVRAPHSSDTAISLTVAYALRMRKTPLVVSDCPGFLINRILGAYFTAFLLLVRDGADFRNVDRVMESWGWPMGPAYLLDVAGLDTLNKAMKILSDAYPTVMGTSFRTAIQTLADNNRLGQKSGSGFYRYERDSGGSPRRSDNPEAIDLISQVQESNRGSFDDQEIEDRMMLAMILEADRCLEEGVAESAGDIDTGMRFGTGFPANHGGPLWYADTLGLLEIVERCSRHAVLGGLYSPSENLIQRARSRGGYYY